VVTLAADAGRDPPPDPCRARRPAPADPAQAVSRLARGARPAGQDEGHRDRPDAPRDRGLAPPQPAPGADLGRLCSA